VEMPAVLRLKLGRDPEKPLGADFPPVIEAVRGIDLIGRPSEHDEPQNPKVRPESYHSNEPGQTSSSFDA
jgi:hypothetical protein